MSVDLRLVAARVERGDTAAFREIVSHTQARLFRLAVRMLADPANAEDALQDAYLKAFRAMRGGRYDGTSKVTTWLHRIVANSCIDALRKRREQLGAKGPEPQFDGEMSADARMALRDIERWVGDLPDAQRAVVVLRLVEGMSAKEAAEILNCSESAVEQRLVRARTALRDKRQMEDARHD